MSLAGGMQRRQRAGRRSTQGVNTTAITPLRNPVPPSFQHYRLESSYDEMFEAPGLPRPHYQALSVVVAVTPVNSGNSERAREPGQVGWA
jgi:hypothetical protein